VKIVELYDSEVVRNDKRKRSAMEERGHFGGPGDDVVIDLAADGMTRKHKSERSTSSRVPNFLELQVIIRSNLR
jgi:hypothetical protein